MCFYSTDHVSNRGEGLLRSNCGSYEILYTAMTCHWTRLKIKKYCFVHMVNLNI